MEHVLRPRSSIKDRIKGYFRLVFLVTMIFVLAVLRYSIRTIDTCNETLKSMTVAETFFQQVDELQTASEGYLLYAEKIPPESFQEELLEIEKHIDYLKQIEVSQEFYRIVTDIEQAMQSVRSGILSMPEKSQGIKALKQYYDEEFQTTLYAFNGIRMEEAGISAMLLTAGAQLQTHMTRYARRYGLLMIMLLVIWGLLMIRYGVKVGKRISIPIEKLTQEVLHIRGSKIDELKPIEVDENKSWEVEKLTDAFNQLVEQVAKQWHIQEEKAELEKSLHEQTVENLRMAGLLKSSQMQALQRQINPHFLFNTLNMIMDTAYLEEAPETAELLKSAAAFLRYSLDCCEKEVTLERELQALGDYVFLQEKRFGDRIFFEFDLDETVEGAHLPALVLQPLVENAVAHGVGTYAKNAHIQIRTRRNTDGRIRIDVSDNGVGMNDEKLQSLQIKLASAARGEESEGGIGLTNVVKKLFVFFHGQAEIEVKSAENKGTQVSLYFPDDCTKKSMQ